MPSTTSRDPAAPGRARPVATVLAPERWSRLEAAHAERADALTAGHRARRAAGERHAVEDFLYEYYGTRPAQLRRWHPGVGTGLGTPPGGVGASPGGAEADGAPPRRAWRWYATTDDVVHLDVDAFLADRGSTVTYVRTLLTATASRSAFTGCLGLHEWAMVYRGATDRRHDLPLRLGPAGTDAVVERHPVRCSHIDAFRFFTPDAVPLNRLQPTRETQVALEQPGCLHANMDCLKWAIKLGPACPGDLLLDCFALASEIRVLDMQASPYDLAGLGYEPVAIETPEGRAEYVARQRAFAARAAGLRARLVAVCDALVAAAA
ncbi:3-methyladenine DNA glycosylase [Actinotalea solisilvae]|uniref:3-methyladenine DNA glycosylase n=1 Tax=Actinotalea solisilvae TaxID=2072922 RepID=UPI003558F284